MPTSQLVYFSPTGTTRRIVSRIAEGIGGETTHYDLTLPQQHCELKVTEGIVIFGVPVYAGRVPEQCLERFQGITAQGTPAAIVAVYGNRAFEDTLVELRDRVSERGFQVIAAGAFIGEHSYATPDYPVAMGRPDARDLDQAFQFGKRIAEKLIGSAKLPAIAGNVPYRDRVQFGGIAPETQTARCTLCKTCAEVCPTGVISVSDSVKTSAEGCIMCCACVKSCPTQARIFTDNYIQERRELLVKNCSSRKEPQLFL